jgi:hypothetical protein
MKCIVMFIEYLLHEGLLMVFHRHHLASFISSPALTI